LAAQRLLVAVLTLLSSASLVTLLLVLRMLLAALLAFLGSAGLALLRLALRLIVLAATDFGLAARLISLIFILLRGELQWHSVLRRRIAPECARMSELVANADL
jgi:hypothetical protein